jgi:hypothetical protein
VKGIHNNAMTWPDLMGFVGVLCLAVSFGCSGDEEVASVEKRPPPGVNLPETPILVTQPIKEYASEGVYTVAGVFENADQKMGKLIRAQGVVASREICVPEMEDEETFCPTPPHLVLVDSLGTPRQQLKVVGSLEQIRAIADGGEPISVEGVLQQWNDDLDPTYDKFFVDSRGLIQLPAPSSEPVVTD